MDGCLGPVQVVDAAVSSQDSKDLTQRKMAKKMALVALLLLILAAAATFLGVFYGVERKQKQDDGFYRAAVAADAGPCSQVGV